MHSKIRFNNLSGPIIITSQHQLSFMPLIFTPLKNEILKKKEWNQIVFKKMVVKMSSLS